MLNNNAQEFDKLLKGYGAMKLKLAQQAAGMAVAFFKDSFRNQGFTDNALVRWKPRVSGTPDDVGRAILIGKGGGKLRKAIRIKSATQNGAIVEVDPAFTDPEKGYAQVHNFGAEIPVTPMMRRHFWKMYYEAGGKGANAQFYKNMALTKKQFITIPKRQFIGNSKTLEKQLTNYFIQELNKFFKVSS